MSKVIKRTAKSITATNAVISSTQSKFSGTSGLFDGTGDSANITSGLSDFAFGTGDFTIEGWYYFNANVNGAYMYDFRNVGSQAVPALFYETAGTRLCYYVSGNYRITYTWTPPLNTWHHIAITRTGTSTKMFVNGVQGGSTWTDTTNYIQPSLAYIGRYGQSSINYMNAYLDEFRISKGIGRYTTAFTAPTEAFVNDDYTVLLMHFIGTPGTSTFLDDNL